MSWESNSTCTLWRHVAARGLIRSLPSGYGQRQWVRLAGGTVPGGGCHAHEFELQPEDLGVLGELLQGAVYKSTLVLFHTKWKVFAPDALGGSPGRELVREGADGAEDRWWQAHCLDPGLPRGRFASARRETATWTWCPFCPGILNGSQELWDPALCPSQKAAGKGPSAHWESGWELSGLLVVKKKSLSPHSME